MTHQAILEKAIAKAVENGWDQGDWFFNKTGELCNVSMEAGLIGLPDNAEYGIIFDHKFAQALWSNEPHDFGGMSDRCIRCRALDRRLDDNGTFECWQYYLQQMVIAPDPIAYLGEHLPD